MAERRVDDDGPMDPRWDLAIDLLIAGHAKKSIAERCGVHRNTLTTWLRAPAFRIELSRRLDEVSAATKLRRMRQTSAYVDRLRGIADQALTAAERDPQDCDAQRTARSWLRNYVRLLREERIDLGVAVQTGRL